jgi:hypothetical protein
LDVGDTGEQLGGVEGAGQPGWWNGFVDRPPFTYGTQYRQEWPLHSEVQDGQSVSGVPSGGCAEQLKTQ